MIGMILIDNMGPDAPWWLAHAEWNGLTPADLIFPSFLFIMGMAIPLAVS
jgi:predicted acyltransferase